MFKFEQNIYNQNNENTTATRIETGRLTKKLQQCQVYAGKDNSSLMQ